MLQRNVNQRVLVLFIKIDIMLHFVQTKMIFGLNNKKEGNSSLTSVDNFQGSSNVLLETAKVLVKSKTSSQLSPARFFFDSCSQLSYVTHNLKRKLNLASIK